MATEQAAQLKPVFTSSSKDIKADSGQTKKHKKKKPLTHYTAFYFMLLPGLIVLIINNYLPMIGVIMPFEDYKYDQNSFITSLFNSKFVGFEKFRFLVSTSDAIVAMRNTILYNIVFIVLDVIVPVALAIAMSEMWSKHIGNFYQSAIFLPYFISWVAVSYVVYAFFVNKTGFINNTILNALGIPSIDYYAQPGKWPLILTFFHLWKYTGYNLIVYIASLSGINGEYYEAANIDGATKWQQVKYVTLPMLKTTMVILTLIAVGRIFNGDFDLFYNVPMNTGILYPATQVIDTYVYNCMINLSDVSMTAAAGMFQAVVGCVIVIMANAAVRKVDNESSLF